MEAADQKLYYKIGEACRVLDIQPYVCATGRPNSRSCN